MRQPSPVQFIVKPTTQSLERYLFQVRQRVAVAKTRLDRIKWLALQASIEAEINTTQQPKSDV